MTRDSCRRFWLVVVAALAPASCSRPAPSPVLQGAASQPVAPITEFQGTYRFLSNFWPAEVVYEGVTFPSSEHAYQAAKTLDIAERRRIASMPDPAEAKREGRRLVQRPDWEAVKFRVMEDCVRDKFTRHPDLGRKLLDTGEAELIEGNTWGDRTWGVFEGQGENRLGKILMKIRAELRVRRASAAPPGPAGVQISAAASTIRLPSA